MSGTTRRLEPSGPITALVLAAGTGSRMGMTRPKVLAELAGRAILEWSVEAFLAVDAVDRVIVVAPADHHDEVAELLHNRSLGADVVDGGPTRSASTRAGLRAISAGAGLVLVHDGARPLVTADTINAVIAALAEDRAASVAIPATDTMVRVAGDFVVDIPDRSELWHAQTPQGFDLELIRAAYSAAPEEEDGYSDDTGVVRRYFPDVRIRIVPGSPDNIKITRPGDIEVAESLLAARGARHRPYSE